VMMPAFTQRAELRALARPLPLPKTA